MPARDSAQGKGSAQGKVDDKKIHVETLDAVHDIYSGEEGLVARGKQLDELAERLGLSKATKLRINKPSRNIMVMLVGNHSAGKSSLINYYIEEDVVKTSMAIETKGFTFVRKGKVKLKAPIQGEGTLRYFPQLETMKEQFGENILESICTVFSTSSSRCFPLLDFVDTPGLVDGGVSYPFDVNDAIIYMAGHVDLVCCLMDPHGQALGSRTMQVVERLQKAYAKKTKYYLTKVDTVEKEADLQKLIVQVTANISKHVQKEHGFELPCIYIPDKATAQHLSRVNSIGKLFQEFETCIDEKVQKHLNTLKSDANNMLKATKDILQADARAVSAKGKRRIVAALLYFVALALLVFGILRIILSLEFLLPKAITEDAYYVDARAWIAPSRDSDEAAGFFSSTVAFVKYTLFFIATWFVAGFVRGLASSYATLTGKERKDLQKMQKHLASVLEKRNSIFDKFLARLRDD